MPLMNGIEPQRRVNAELKLPVVIMSSDDRKSEMLESEAVSYQMKPIKKSELMSVWQYAHSCKKGKGAVIVDGDNTRSMSSSVESLCYHEQMNSASSVNEDNCNPTYRKGNKRQRDNDDDDHDVAECRQPVAQKKEKVVWSSSLHNRFLQAINHIGLEKVVPKNILKFMNVPGLTKDNIASHLQKYRLFLKKVTGRNINASRQLRGRDLKSTFARGYDPMVFGNSPTAYYHHQFRGKQHQMTTTSSSYSRSPGRNSSTLESSNLSAVRFSNYDHEASGSKNPEPARRYGQSSLMDNQNGYTRHPSRFGNNSLFGNGKGSSYQANRFGLQSHSAGPSSRSPSCGLVNATGHGNSLMNLQKSQQPNQASRNLHHGQFGASAHSQDASSSSSFHLQSSSGILARSNTISAIGNRYSSISNSSLAMNANINGFVGMDLSPNGELIGNMGRGPFHLVSYSTNPSRLSSATFATGNHHALTNLVGNQNEPYLHNWSAQEGSSCFSKSTENQCPLLDTDAVSLKNENFPVRMLPPPPPAIQPQEQREQSAGVDRNLSSVENWSPQEGPCSFSESRNLFLMLDSTGAINFENEKSLPVLMTPPPPVNQPQEPGQQYALVDQNGGTSNTASANNSMNTASNFSGNLYDPPYDVGEADLSSVFLEPADFEISYDEQEQGEAEGVMRFPNDLFIEWSLLTEELLNDDFSYLHFDDPDKPLGQVHGEEEEMSTTFGNISSVDPINGALDRNLQQEQAGGRPYGFTPS